MTGEVPRPLADVDVKFIQTIQRYLLKYNGDAHPKTETLAKEVGVDKSTLLRHRHKLVREGYMTFEPSTGRGKSNRYFLTERVAKGSQESVAKGGDATLVVLSTPKVLSTTESVVLSSRTTRPESVAVRPENDSPSPALRSAGSAPAQGIPGTAQCWKCGVLVVTSRHGDRLRGFRPDEAQPDVWQHRVCPGTTLRRCHACGGPVDPLTPAAEYNRLLDMGEENAATTAISGYELQLRERGPIFISHDWPDCENTVTKLACDEADAYQRAYSGKEADEQVT